MTMVSFARNTAVERALHHFIRRVSVPVARIAIHNRVPLSSTKAALQAAFVEVAINDFAEGGRRPTDSEIQLLTGIRRQSIKAIERADGDTTLETSPLARILCAWGADRRFLDNNGRPKDLPISGVGAPTFADLVKTHGQGVTVKVTLDRLRADGNVELLDSGYVRLVSTFTGNPKDLVTALSVGCASLVYHFETVFKNLSALQSGESNRYYEQRRYSLHIPAERESYISAKIRRVLENANAEIAEILDREEVSPERHDLITQGAGFFEFKSNS